MEYRTLKLTHEEIEIINQALNIAYSETLKASENRVLTNEIKNLIIKESDKFANIRHSISDGKKDV